MHLKANQAKRAVCVRISGNLRFTFFSRVSRFCRQQTRQRKQKSTSDKFFNVDFPSLLFHKKIVITKNRLKVCANKHIQNACRDVRFPQETKSDYKTTEITNWNASELQHKLLIELRTFFSVRVLIALINCAIKHGSFLPLNVNVGTEMKMTLEGSWKVENF